MVDMEIIPEKGCWMCSSPRYPYEYEPFYYDHVGWYKGFKFVFGKFRGDRSYRMYEVSTRAIAATPTDSRSTSILVADFSLKLGAHGGDIGKVIAKFNDTNRDKKTLPLWLNTLIG